MTILDPRYFGADQAGARLDSVMVAMVAVPTLERFSPLSHLGSSSSRLTSANGTACAAAHRKRRQRKAQ